MCFGTEDREFVEKNVFGDTKHLFFPLTHDLLVSQKMMQRHFFFFHPASSFPSNFCICNSGVICTASQFYFLGSASIVIHSVTVRQCLLRNQPESDAVTSCNFLRENYKGHSLMQTRFTEPPNRWFADHCGYFLAYQLLALPLRVDPIPFSWLSNTALIIIIITDCFYTVLFSAHKQIHRAHVACYSEWLSSSFSFKYIFFY